MKYLRSEVHGMFQRLAKALSESEFIEKERSGWYLDYNAVCGGYVIEYVNKEGGAIHHPFGAKRRNAKEMYLSMAMAVQAAELMTFNRLTREIA